LLYSQNDVACCSEHVFGLPYDHDLVLPFKSFEGKLLDDFPAFCLGDIGLFVFATISIAPITYGCIWIAFDKCTPFLNVGITQDFFGSAVFASADRIYKMKVRMYEIAYLYTSRELAI